MRKAVFTWNSSTLSYQISTRTKFFYDGWNLIGQTDEVSGTRMTFLWGKDLSGTMQGAGGVGGLLAVTERSPYSQPSTHFPCFDGNGNVMALVEAADGGVSAQYEYGPFGELIRATGPMAKLNPVRWSTQYTDEGTDLVCYLHRYYAPRTGRWLSRDPIGEEGNMGLYGFVGNQPVNLVDLFGLQSWIGPGYGTLPTPGRNLPTTPGSSTATIGGWGLGFDWLLGTSQSDRHFVEGDYMTEAMKNSDITKLQREVIRKDIANYCRSVYGPPNPNVKITRPLGEELDGIPEVKYVSKFLLVDRSIQPRPTQAVGAADT